MTLADARLLPVPDGCDDVTGASLVSDGDVLHAFLSARPDGGTWRIYRTGSRDGGSTWTTPHTVLEPSAGPQASDGEIRLQGLRGSPYQAVGVFDWARQWAGPGGSTSVPLLSPPVGRAGFATTLG